MAFYQGTLNDDVIKGSAAIDTILGAAGNDLLSGAGAADLIDGGSGNDTLDGGSGYDVLVYRLDETAGAHDTYRGGNGVDMLRLELSADEWSMSSVQYQLGLYLVHLAGLTRNPAGEIAPGVGNDFTLQFGSAGLLMSAVERVDVYVAGVKVDLAAPSFAGGELSGTVAEDTNSGTLSDSGGFTFHDLDWSQSHAIKVSKLSASLGGKLQANVSDVATGDGQGTVEWSYSLPNSKVQSLALGQVATESFRITLTDSAGKTLRQDVSVSVSGANDVPKVLTIDNFGDLSAGTAGPSIDDSGLVSYDDVDLIDQHTLTVLPGTGNTLGGLFSITELAVATGPTAGTLQWTYSLNAAHVQYLAAGQIASETFTVRIDDGHGGIVNRVVTLKITGINDAPQTDTTLAELGLVEDQGTVSGSGTMAFSDPDLSDLPTLSSSADPANQLGGVLVAALTDSSQGDGQGQVEWSYTADNAKLQFLAEGQTATERFTVMVDDGRSGSVNQLITVTITGTNDVPTLGAVVDSLTLSEDETPGLLTGAGSLDFADVDLSDAPSVSSSADPANLLGGVLVTNLLDTSQGDGNGQVGWTYQVDNAAVQHLGTGQSAVERFTVVLDDGHGGSLSRTIVVTVNGSDETTAAMDTRVETNSDTAIEGWLGATDGSGPVTFALLAGPGHGQLSLDADGHYRYTPALGFHGSDGFGFTMSDANGGLSTGTATVAVASRGPGQLIGLAADDPAQALPGSAGSGRPDLAATTAGDHVLVWRGAAVDGESGMPQQAILMQRCDADGRPMGAALQLALASAGDISNPAVSALSDGRLAVVWSAELPGGGAGIYCRVVQADGAAAGEALVVGTVANGVLPNPGVSALASGGLVVTWQGMDESTGHIGMWAQVLDAAATATGAALALASSTSAQALDDATGADQVATLANGRFMVVWGDITALDGSGQSVQARVFDAGGNAVQATQFTVNQQSLGHQAGASVCALDGSFLVTWTSDGQDGAGLGVFARRFDADGTALGNEFAVASLTAGDQQQTRSTALSDGGFVVVWTSSALGIDHVHGQRFDAAGARVGDEFLLQGGERVGSGLTGAQGDAAIVLRADGALVVAWRADDGHLHQRVVQDIGAQTLALGEHEASSGLIVNNQSVPDLAALSSGGHVVVWSASAGGGNPDDSGFGVYLQRYDAAGHALGGAQLVNSTLAESQYSASVATLANGKVAVTWSAYGQDSPDSFGVYTRLFDANGLALTGETLVNSTSVSEDQFESNVAELAGGNYVITWRGYNSANVSDDIYARTFSASGAPSGSAFIVNTTRAGAQLTEGSLTDSVVGLAGGRFVVVWTDANGLDGDGYGVYARVYEANRSAVNAAQFAVNTHTTGDQHYASVAALGSGFVATWSSSQQDGSGYGIHAQRFDAAGERLGGEFAVNQATVGDQVLSRAQQLADGSFVILWHSAAQTGSDDIHGQRFDAGGAPLLGEFIVNGGGALGLGWAGHQGTPTVALRADGALVVSWRDSSANLIGQRVIDSFADDTVPISRLQADLPVGSPVMNPKGAPHVVALADGGHVVVWSATAGGGNADGSGCGIYLQRYGADGPAAAAPVAINQATEGDQADPALALLADGRIMVTWTTVTDFGTTQAVFGRVLDALGQPQGAEMRLDDAGTGPAVAANVAALADGGFALVWQTAATGALGSDIYLRVYTASGALAGATMPLSTAGGDQRLHGPDGAQSITTLVDGRFVVVWTDTQGLDGSGSAVLARLHAADGTPLQGAAWQVNTTTTAGDQADASVVAQGSGFLVTWSSQHGAGGWDIRAQRYAADGSALGTEIAVNSQAAGDQLHAKAAVLADGSFVVLWQTTDAAQAFDLHGQRFSAAGQAQGEEFLVNSTGADGLGLLGAQHWPSLALRADGALIVAWHDTDAGSIEYKIVSDFDSGQLAPKVIAGGAGPDALLGGALGDTIAGGGGSDRIDGLNGIDQLGGGAGADHFIFSSALVAPNADYIDDFESGVDTIVLDQPGLWTHGELPASAFDVLGDDLVANADTRIVYNPASGQLYYDIDGDGLGAGAPIVTLTNLPPDLSAADFWLGV